MHSSSQPPCGQLTDIANRIQAAGLLMHCIGRQQQDEYQPICDTAARQLHLYAESIRLYSTRLQGQAATPSSSLAMDISVADMGDANDLLDEYACCQLRGLVSAIGALKFIYQSSTDRFCQMVGSALFCCLHWIELARRELVALLSKHD